MPKSIILLLLCLLPFSGTPQSARKLNKQLRAEYTARYHQADSVRKIHEKELGLWESTKNAFYDSIYSFRAIDRKYETLSDSVNHKRIDLERLGVEEVNGVDYEYLYAFFRKSQEAEFIFGSFFDRLGFLDVVLGKGVYLDSVIDLELYDLDFQNDYLQRELESIVLFYTTAGYDQDKIAESLIAMDTAQMQITALKQTLKEMAPTLRAYNLILEKELAVKRQFFAKNGPEGFDEAWFDVFPDVFPPKIIEQHYIEPIIVEEFNKGAAFEPVSERIAPPVEAPKEDKVYQFVDEPAEYPGGIEAMNAFIEANLKIPEVAIRDKIEGKCYLQFVVSAKGNISNVKVVRGVPDCDECDKEAIRMVKSMPKWKSGKIEGKPVNSTFNLPVSFKLS